MSVFKRKDGLWAIQVQIDGKRHTCYSIPETKKGFHKRSEAVSYEPLFLASITAKPLPQTIIVNSSFLDDFYSFIKMKLKPSTFYGYKDTFEKYWKPMVSGMKIEDFNNSVIEMMANRLFAHKQNWNGKSASGKWFVKYLKRMNPLLDPSIICAPKISKPKIHEYHIYTEEEFSRFVSVIDDERDRFLFSILFYYGLRISECLALRWSDFKDDGLHIERSACVKNDSHKVIFTTPKTTNSIRVYPIIDILKPFIKDLKPSTDYPCYVFKADYHGSQVMGQSSVRRKSVYYANKAGVKVIRLHEFRHSCVSNLLMHKLPVRLVARWVGDTESMVLNTYSHLLPNEKDTIADFINDYQKSNVSKNNTNVC